MLRTHTCGELKKTHAGKKVSLCGWNHSRRDHGGVIFIDVRDRYGLTQLVFEPKHDKKVHAEAEKLKREDCIRVTGTVRARGKGLENPNLATGQIEVLVDRLEILNKSEMPPIEIDDRKDASEEVALKYRYLDLRRPKMLQRFITRHNVVQAAREYLGKNNFLETDTPLLMVETPEGARDYVVPSRVHPGKFYALPQSPQLYKQLLMIAGFDRYYQFAKCLRDEDLRGDRQPEHTQIDLEMSFCELEDLLQMWEGLITHIWKEVTGKKLKPFPRLKYKDSMEKYGCDKPDLRFGLELVNLTEDLKDCEFSVFADTIKKGGIVKCINPEKDLTRKEIEDYTNYVAQFGAKGLAWMRVTSKGIESSVVKFFTAAHQKRILEKTKAKKGSTLLFVADTEKRANDILFRLRNKLAADLGLYKTGDVAFCYVTDFPLFEWNEDESKWDPAHHFFCMPYKEHIPLIEKDPGKVHCTQYDLVCNGIEFGSGSIRIHDPALQKKIMKVVGYPEEKAQESFGFLLDAYKYGGPPHGGIGLGLDRICAVLCGFDNPFTHDIRTVYTFPKTKSGENPLDGCPRGLSEKRLKELHLKVDVQKK